MALPDIDSLLAPVDQAVPCGPNLEYEAPFLALAAAARGKPEQQLGTHIVPAEPPDWRAVRQQAEALLARTKDLRVAMLLTRALVHTAQLPGLRAGLALLDGLLERYWDHVHPVPEADDPDGAIERANALVPLVDPNDLLCDVRNALVVASGPHGKLSVRDILRTASRRPPAPGETVPAAAEVDAALVAAGDPALLGAAAASADIVRSIQARMTARVGSTRAPNLDPLLELLAPVADACARARAAAPPAQAAAVEAFVPAADGVAGDVAGHAAGAPAAATVPGEIGSREEAMRVLDSVCRFYARNEPGHPLPLLIRRAQRLSDKNFVEILEDLAPDSVAQVRTIAGIPAQENRS